MAKRLLGLGLGCWVGLGRKGYRRHRHRWCGLQEGYCHGDSCGWRQQRSKTCLECEYVLYLTCLECQGKVNVESDVEGDSMQKTKNKVGVDFTVR